MSQAAGTSNAPISWYASKYVCQALTVPELLTGSLTFSHPGLGKVRCSCVQSNRSNYSTQRQTTVSPESLQAIDKYITLVCVSCESSQLKSRIQGMKRELTALDAAKRISSESLRSPEPHPKWYVKANWKLDICMFQFLSHLVDNRWAGRCMHSAVSLLIRAILHFLALWAWGEFVFYSCLTDLSLYLE